MLLYFGRYGCSTCRKMHAEVFSDAAHGYVESKIFPVANQTSPDAKFHIGTEQFEEWVSHTKLMDNSAKSRAWFEENKARVKRKYEEYLPVWMNKSAQDLAERTLVPQHGL